MTREAMVSMTFRLPLQLRDAANIKATERDEYLSEAIREFLQWYVDKDSRITYELNDSSPVSRCVVAAHPVA